MENDDIREAYNQALEAWQKANRALDTRPTSRAELLQLVETENITWKAFTLAKERFNQALLVEYLG